MLNKKRLKKAKDFEAVRTEAKSWADQLLVLKVRPNGLGTSRAGFVVTKRLGKAVTRNRIKRRLKEAVRLTSVTAGFDFVIIARRHVVDADYGSLIQSVKTLFRRAKILN